MAQDFRISVDWRGHHKRKKVKRRLGAAGVLAIQDLWSFAAERKPDGILSGMTPEDIAIAVDYDGDPDELITTLVEVGLLEVVDGVYLLHDWTENQPWVAGEPKRKASAKAAADAKWEKRNAVGIKNDASRNAPRIEKQQNRIAPSPSPSPSPLPSPDPIPSQEGDRASASAPSPRPAAEVDRSVLEEETAIDRDGVADGFPSPGSAAPLPRTGGHPFTEAQVARLRDAIPSDMGRMPPWELPANIKHELAELVNFSDLVPTVQSKWRDLENDEKVSWAAWGIRKAKEAGKAPVDRLRHAARLIGKALVAGAPTPEAADAPQQVTSKIAHLSERQPGGKPKGVTDEAIARARALHEKTRGVAR